VLCKILLAPANFFIGVIILALSAGLTLAIVWAMKERALRRRKTEYFQSRIRSLEQRLDPERTSSKLTPGGDTNPEDAK